MRKNHDFIEIAEVLRHETQQAYLLFEGDKEVWIPKSLCRWDGAEKVMQMPEGLALDKGLI